MKKYFDSLDTIPLFNWWKVREGNYEYTRVNPNEGSKRKDIEAFIKINDLYLSEFGFSKDETKIIELKRELALKQCEFVISNDNFVRNEIRRLEIELEEILDRDVQAGLDNEEFLIYLEKWIGFRLEPKVISAMYFYKVEKNYKTYSEMLASR